MPMPFKANNRYLIRIYYHECRIALEAHHSLGDGSGGMYVLQTITAVYLRLLGHSISTGGFVLDVDSPPDPEELEDAYHIFRRLEGAHVRQPRRGVPVLYFRIKKADGVILDKKRDRFALRPPAKAVPRLASEAAACENSHARQLEALFSVKDAAQFYYYGISLH